MGKEGDKPVLPQPEDIETDYRPINWKKVFFTPKYIPWHILGIAILVATVLITLNHDAVVGALRPFSESLRDLPAGWLIPIAILFVISFPPLFGHEIVAVLCGVVWGLWIGFGVVAAGTFVGEVGTWYAFKYLFRKRSHRMEMSNLNYGALARLTREGGFWIVLVIRLSVIPSHFSTAVFSACDVKFWHFAVATFLALPKQIVLVYLGVLLINEENEAKNSDSDSDSTSRDTQIQTGVFGATFIVTLVLGVWIWHKMRAIKKELLAEQAARKAAVAATTSGQGLEMQSLAGPGHNGSAGEFDEEAMVGGGGGGGGHGKYGGYGHPRTMTSSSSSSSLSDNDKDNDRSRKYGTINPQAGHGDIGMDNGTGPGGRGYFHTYEYSGGGGGRGRSNSVEDDLNAMPTQQPHQWV